LINDDTNRLERHSPFNHCYTVKRLIQICADLCWIRSQQYRFRPHNTPCTH